MRIIIREVNAKIFEVPDDITNEEIGTQYETGELLMDNVDLCELEVSREIDNAWTDFESLI